MLQDKIAADLTQAMKAREKTRVEALRMLRAAIKNTEIAQQKTLEDSDILAVVAKEVKQHRESISEFQKGNRQDLVAKEEAELTILLEYLPRQMSRDEIAAAAQQVIQEVGARGPGDKGKVMQKLMPQLKGKADGRDVNETVTELLSGL